MNKYNFSRNNYFSQKNASGRADRSCDNLGKYSPTKGFLDRRPKKCERLDKFQKMFFSKNFHGYLDFGFRKCGDIFLLEVKKKIAQNRRKKRILLF